MSAQRGPVLGGHLSSLVQVSVACGRDPMISGVTVQRGLLNEGTSVQCGPGVSGERAWSNDQWREGHRGPMISGISMQGALSNARRYRSPVLGGTGVQCSVVQVSRVVQGSVA